MNIKKYHQKYNLWNILWLAILIAVLIPMVISISYTVPGADDYAMADNTTIANIIPMAFEHATYLYLNWIGQWTYAFLETILNPIIWFAPGSRMCGIEMIVLFFGFLASIAYLIYMVRRYIFRMQDKFKFAFVFVGIVVTLLNAMIYRETFYWFVGSVYMWGVSMCFVVMGMTIRYFTCGYKTKTAVAISIIGAATCMMYNEAILPGMTYLLLWIWAIKKEGKTSFKHLVPLLFMIAGGLAAVLAPGNYVRYYSDVAEKIEPVKALAITAKQLFQTERDLLLTPFMIPLLIALVAFGAYMCRGVKFDFRWPLIPWILSLVCMYITCFAPVLGGYTKGLVERVTFIMYIYSLIVFSASAIYTGGYLAHKGLKLDVKKYTITIAAIGVAVIIELFGFGQYHRMAEYQIMAEMDSVRAYSNGWRNAVITICESENPNVILDLPVSLKENRVLYYVSICEYVETNVNVQAARQYGKNAVMVNWIY